ncbi:phage portal protein [Sphaerisporangium sp. TRM90804]|uniref:phage portal protein n=1 Tax=Sphaerisporangium sp. TRM90804 TaxID=3031113 RepID=UPI002447D926|nr:phage portal protein [Sphaerisporangium sp. TRM90804]MDH2429328.1 phage portal protein [Sphaerisporangium sp. TRM90804]
MERLRFPLISSSGRQDQERIENDFEGYAAGIYKRSGPVFSLMDVRAKVFSEARFQFRRYRNGRPGDLFGESTLERLENPWPGGTTGDMLARMLQDADLAGNGWLTYHAGRIRRMRPDRVTIVLGSRSEPDGDMPAGYLPLDVEVLGYMYSPQALGSDGDIFLLPSQVAHFAPIPDPEAHFRGMSWLTPLLREVSADTAATTHKLKFFENAASPRFVVRVDANMEPEKFKRFRAIMEEGHAGVDNSFRTMYLGGGADITPLTFDLRQLDFKAVQGGGETRLASAAGVPPVIAGFSEGLAGSSLNAGNYSAAKRRFVDATMRPLWRNAAGSLATLVDVPKDAELWYDARDIPFLHEDARDAADIFQVRMETINSAVREGFTADSAKAAVAAEDENLLVHTGLVSVQLQPPGTPHTAPPAEDR